MAIAIGDKKAKMSFNFETTPKKLNASIEAIKSPFECYKNWYNLIDRPGGSCNFCETNKGLLF